MTNFPFDDGIPAANNNPSNDQPNLLINNQSTNGILNEDHISFEQDNGGTHRKMTFYQNATPLVPAGSTESQIYPAQGVASTSSDTKFVNFSGTYLLNAIRAFGSFSTVATNGALALPTQILNVASITSSNNGQTYTIVLTTNAVGGTTNNDVVVLTNLSNNGTQTWSFAANTLTLNTNAGSTGGQKYSFAILQV